MYGRMIFLLAGLALALSGCGLITASVSVPEAFTHNNDLGLKGTITDERGQNVDDVLVTVKREYYLWHADASYSEFDSMTLLLGHQFEVPKRRAHELDFTFRKTGYADQTIVVGQKAIEGDYRLIQGNQWPLDTPVHIIMQKADRPAPPLRWLVLRVDYTDPEKNPVIDLGQMLAPSSSLENGYSTERLIGMSQSALTMPAADKPVPANSLYAIIERQPTKTGPDHRVDPLDLNLPAKFALRLSDTSEGSGFQRVMPAAGTNPLAQLAEAPEKDYQTELVLTGTRLRQMRDTASNMVPDRNEFFYFHVNGHYGKGVLSWNSAATSDPTGPLQLFIVLVVQPDGSRTLTSPNGS